MPSELPPSTHLPTLKGWRAELAVSCWLVVCTVVAIMGFKPTWADPTRFETLRLNHLVTTTTVSALVFSYSSKLTDCL